METKKDVQDSTLIGSEIPTNTSETNYSLIQKNKQKIQLFLKEKRKIFYVIIPLLAVFIIGFGAYLILNGGFRQSKTKQGGSQQTTTLATPKPKTYPIVQGKETYTVSQSKSDGPRFTKITIDPHDPEVGTLQTFTLFTQHTIPIEWVQVTLTTDNKVVKHNLNLSNGTDFNGEWSGTWKTNDTHLYKYDFLIEAGDGTNTSGVDLLIR